MPLCRIDIPSTFEKNSTIRFWQCKSSSEIIFESESHLREIAEFRECTGLHWVTIPTWVESFSAADFSECPSPTEVLFKNGSNLREISGLQGCGSLHQIETLKNEQLPFDWYQTKLNIGDKKPPSLCYLRTDPSSHEFHFGITQPIILQDKLR
jgi:hypothetical protein